MVGWDRSRSSRMRFSIVRAYSICSCMLSDARCLEYSVDDYKIAKLMGIYGARRWMVTSRLVPVNFIIFFRHSRTYASTLLSTPYGFAVDEHSVGFDAEALDGLNPLSSPKPTLTLSLNSTSLLFFGVSEPKCNFPQAGDPNTNPNIF